MSRLHAIPSCTSHIRFLHVNPTCPAPMSSLHEPHFFTTMPLYYTLSHTLLYSLHAIRIYHMQMLHADDTPSYRTHICRTHIIPQPDADCPPYIPNHNGTHTCLTSSTIIYLIELAVILSVMWIGAIPTQRPAVSWAKGDSGCRETPG